MKHPLVSTSPVELVLNAIQALSPAQRATFYDLSHVGLRNLTNAPSGNIALAITQTNAVSAGDGVGVFPTMARLNHGCSKAFNVVYSWRPDEGIVVVHALRDIEKGQELLTTYTDTKRPRNERQ